MDKEKTFYLIELLDDCTHGQIIDHAQNHDSATRLMMKHVCLPNNQMNIRVITKQEAERKFPGKLTAYETIND
jgi:hypothetical protein